MDWDAVLGTKTHSKPSPQPNWKSDPPTEREIKCITRLCMQLHIKEPLEESVRNKLEARQLRYQLLGALHAASTTRQLDKKRFHKVL